jgi:signal transduction histidine kinase
VPTPVRPDDLGPPDGGPPGAAAPGGVTADALRRAPVFADLGESELAWIAARCELLVLAPGDALFRPGQAAEWMFVALDGTLRAQRESLGPGAPAFVFRAGEIAGTIPFSRMTTFAGTGRAVTAARVARFPKARFPELLGLAPDLPSRFVALLADRVRDATRRDARFEKLTALGRLSAGLAHELNNPAAAAARGADDALGRLERRAALVAALVAAGVGPAAFARLDAVRAAAAAGAAGAPNAAPGVPLNDVADAAPLDALARSDREEALAAWLAAAGAPDPWDAAATFVEAGLDAAALDRAVSDVPPAARGVALAWLESLLADARLLGAVRQATGRVAQLVEAMKSYTQMDRAQGLVDVDVHAGLESALALLAGRAAERGVTLVREYAPALPAVAGYPADLNEAWGALLDNALDAAATPPSGRGRVTVRTAVGDGAVLVAVGDNGPGVPPALVERIWEPFFTTKPVGRGAGLGLDVARRVVEDEHGGQLGVASAPGATWFTARLPRSTVATFGA